jgi:hypothetical protein
MAILRLSIRPSELFIFAIFRPTIFLFIEDYIRINDTFDLLTRSSEIELGSGSSQIKIFKIIFHYFLGIFPNSLKFRVDLMTY